MKMNRCAVCAFRLHVSTKYSECLCINLNSCMWYNDNKTINIHLYIMSIYNICNTYVWFVCSIQYLLLSSYRRKTLAIKFIETRTRKKNLPLKGERAKKKGKKRTPFQIMCRRCSNQIAIIHFFPSYRT